MSTKPVIALFGSYANANFGDDLMAHMIAASLEEAGYQVRLWRGPNDVWHGRKWDIYNDMDRFLRGACCAVIGGGVVFSDSPHTAYWQDLSGLVAAAARVHCPLIGISLGSHGEYSSVNPAAVDLLQSPVLQALTVRLPEDVDYVSTAGVPVAYYPDIVLAALPYRMRSAHRSLLLCVSVSRWEAPLLRLVCRRLVRQGWQVHSLGQFMAHRVEATSFFRLPGAHIDSQDTAATLRQLADMDVVVGMGLHVGMAGLAGGATFVSYRGSGKVRSVFRAWGFEDLFIQARWRVDKLFSPFQLYRVIRRLPHRPATSKVPELQKEATGHIDFLLKQLESLRQGDAVV